MGVRGWFEMFEEFEKFEKFEKFEEFEEFKMFEEFQCFKGWYSKSSLFSTDTICADLCLIYEL